MKKARIIANNEPSESLMVILASALMQVLQELTAVHWLLSDFLGIQIMVVASGNTNINKLSRFNINTIVNDDNTVDIG